MSLKSGWKKMVNNLSALLQNVLGCYRLCYNANNLRINHYNNYSRNYKWILIEVVFVFFVHKKLLLWMKYFFVMNVPDFHQNLYQSTLQNVYKTRCIYTREHQYIGVERFCFASIMFVEPPVSTQCVVI